MPWRSSGILKEMKTQTSRRRPTTTQIEEVPIEAVATILALSKTSEKKEMVSTATMTTSTMDARADSTRTTRKVISTTTSTMTSRTSPNRMTMHVLMEVGRSSRIQDKSNRPAATYRRTGSTAHLSRRARRVWTAAVARTSAPDRASTPTKANPSTRRESSTTTIQRGEAKPATLLLLRDSERATNPSTRARGQNNPAPTTIARRKDRKCSEKRRGLITIKMIGS